MSRFFYTIKMAWKHREMLLPKSFKKAFCISTISDLSLKKLKKAGIEVLVLDFDGVLAAHGEIELEALAKSWLDRAVTEFGVTNIYILSNKPMPERKAYFEKHFPGLQFIAGVRKKPYPDGLEKILKFSGVKPQALVLVDDRLLTGVLATRIAGTHGVFIKKPYHNLRQHFITESFFGILRQLEKTIFYHQ